MRGFRVLMGGMAAGVVLWGCPAAQACATCFGNSDSLQAQGMNSGILFLLGVVGFVLAGVVSMLTLFAVRSARLARAEGALGMSVGESHGPVGGWVAGTEGGAPVGGKSPSAFVR